MIRSDYAELLTSGRPLLDVRAPAEFRRGALPGAVNLPLLDDEEREAVGIEFKLRGNSAALALGHSVVSGTVRDHRLAQWLAFAERHPDGVMYCFRGGQRSQIVQQWMADAGRPLPRVAGGYKAMRQYLLDELSRLCKEQSVILVGGRAGSGKTHFLNDAIPSSVDLEGLAHHRGSAFGRRAREQPAPADFENPLIIRWLRLEAGGARTIAMEDEGRTIGRLPIPQALWERFETAPIAVLKVRFRERVDQILQDYVVSNLAEFQVDVGERAFDEFSEHLLDSLGRVHRKVGGLRYRALHGIMLEALEAQRASGDTEMHKLWIAPLLRDYYDPMYDYQLEKKSGRIELTDTRSRVRRYLLERMGQEGA